MHANHVAAIWPIGTSYAIRPTDVGFNNLTQFIDTPVSRYVLRVYGNTCDPIRVQYELHVLSKLQGTNLPFAVPMPVITESGELFARIPSNEGATIAALFSAIPGVHPQRGVLSQSYPAGQALGHLVHALSTVDLGSQLGTNPPYGDLYRNHPLVPDPMKVPEQLPLDDYKRKRLTNLFTSLIDVVPGLYATLPKQIIHGDYVRANILIQNDEVSGILDFEFTCWDLRAMDVAIGLGGWPAGLWGTGREWDMLGEFYRGYASEQPLSALEIEALPTLMRLRRAASVLHLTGRCRQGLDPESHLLEMVDWALDMEDWLETNGTNLVRYIQTWTNTKPSR